MDAAAIRVSRGRRAGAARLLLGLCAAVLALGALPVRRPDPVEVDILKLTSIEWQPGDELPRWIRELDGKEIVISGFMNARFDRDADVVLIVGNSCQCSGTPLPHHFVQVKLDKKTRYRGGELTYAGKLSVGEEREDGFVTSLYRLDGKFF
jgi:hypothetical protein